MMERKEVLDFCLCLQDVYEDYPFHDTNWTVMRHKRSRKSFAFIYQKDGVLQVNVKCHPEMISFWRNVYSAVLPGYHMNKTHWNTLLVNGTIPENDLCQMIKDSYLLTKGD